MARVWEEGGLSPCWVLCSARCDACGGARGGLEVRADRRKGGPCWVLLRATCGRIGASAELGSGDELGGCLHYEEKAFKAFKRNLLAPT